MRLAGCARFGSATVRLDFGSLATGGGMWLLLLCDGAAILIEAAGRGVSGRRAFQKTTPEKHRTATTPSGTHHRRVRCRYDDFAVGGAGHGVPAPRSVVDSCSAFFSASRMELNASVP